MRHLLETEIDSSAILDCNYSDLIGVVKNLEIANEALDAFLGQEITFDEYLELLDMAQINIDEYLGLVEQNLTKARLL